MKQKVGFFIDTSQTSGGAFSEVVYMLNKLEQIFQNKIEIIILSTSSKSNINSLNSKINIKYFKMNIFQRYLCYLKNYNSIFRKFGSFLFSNKFENFLKENEIEVVYFVSPSQYALYLEDTDFIITVPDVSHRENVEFPEWAKSSNFFWKENILSKVLIRAIAVITNAAIIKNKIIKFYRVEDNRVHVISHQPSIAISNFKQATSKPTKKYDLPKKYIFYPANFLPHKNHKYIIDVINLLKFDRKKDISAVFCGSDKGYLSKIKKYVSSLNLNNEIIFLDFVKDEDLPFLYLNSIALTMPTFSGPTNIPPWEAFKIGVPVIYSDILGIREVYKDSVYYIDPMRPQTMADAIIDVIDNQSVRKKLVENGKKMLEANNFDKDANKILNILEENKIIKNSWLFQQDN